MEDELRAVLENNTAGSPSVAGLKWTHLTITEIAAELLHQGIKVARRVIKRLLNEWGFKSRQQVKSQTKAPSRNRDEQFRQIETVRNAYKQGGHPVLSIDSKRKESLGSIQRAGDVIANGRAEVLDHALPAYSDGEVTPHGIYDVQRNEGHITFTRGSDTGEFAVDALRHYWDEFGSDHYPDADRVLIHCDCGGSNSFRSHAFKYHLQQWANDANLRIDVAHYPVYCSKYNPIERRLFCHVEQAFSGRIFSTIDDLVEAAAQASTRSGLTTSASKLPEYQPVRRTGKSHAVPPTITHDQNLPDYNYTIVPEENHIQ